MFWKLEYTIYHVIVLLFILFLLEHSISITQIYNLPSPPPFPLHALLHLGSVAHRTLPLTHHPFFTTEREMNDELLHAFNIKEKLLIVNTAHILKIKETTSLTAASTTQSQTSHFVTFALNQGSMAVASSRNAITASSCMCVVLN